MPRSIPRREVLKAGAIIVGSAATAAPLVIQGIQALAASAAPGPLPWPAANTILATTLLSQFPIQEFCCH